MDKNFTWRKLSYSQKKNITCKMKNKNTFYSRYSGKQVNRSSCQNSPQSKCAHTQWEFFSVFLQILHHLVLNIACPKELLPLQLKANEGGQIWSRVTGAAVALFSLGKLVWSVPLSFFFFFVCFWVCSTTFVHSFVVLLHCAHSSWS